MIAFLFLASGYLLGLGLLGYMTVWAWIKERGLRSRWPAWLTNCVIGIHFAAGMSAIGLVPAAIGHQFRPLAQHSVGPFLFAAAIFLLMGVAWLIAQDWSRWYVGSKSDGRNGSKVLEQ